MLRSDGTVADGVVVEPAQPPHAARSAPAATKAGSRRANLMRTTSNSKIPAAFFPRRPRGESAPADRSYSRRGPFFSTRQFTEVVQARALLTPASLSSYCIHRCDNLFGLLTKARARPSCRKHGDIPTCEQDHCI